MENGFHGRTIATPSATGNPAKQRGFGPLLPGFLRVPYDDIVAVHRMADHSPDIVAVLIEPVQGEGGIRAASADYLRELRALCDRHDWLLMLDEIQAGMGRTGAWFGHQHAGASSAKQHGVHARLFRERSGSLVPRRQIPPLRIRQAREAAAWIGRRATWSSNDSRAVNSA